jgi:hypothetical protein
LRQEVHLPQEFKATVSNIVRTQLKEKKKEKGEKREEGGGRERRRRKRKVKIE